MHAAKISCFDLSCTVLYSDISVRPALLTIKVNHDLDAAVDEFKRSASVVCLIAQAPLLWEVAPRPLKYVHYLYFTLPSACS
jgi:hypothetical protein